MQGFEFCCKTREHYQMPTLDETTSQLAGAKYFTVLDATAGYWNVPLSKEASILTTFQTPFGRFCYLRMPFGICSAQEVFQKRMDRVFGELPGVHVIVDLWRDQREKSTTRGYVRL